MRNFVISELATTVTNVNPRKENHGEDKVLRSDINFVAIIGPEHLALLSIDGTGDDWTDKWYSILMDEEGIAGHCINEINFNREFQDHTLIWNADLDEKQQLEFEGVRFCKFKLKIEPDATMLLSFQAQIDPQGHSDRLENCMKEMVRISTRPPAQRDIEDEEEAA